MVGLIFLFIGVLTASALCSMTEAALLSLPFFRVQVLLKRGNPRARDLVYLKENVNPAISSIVVVNNAVNIIGSIFIGQRIAVLFGQEWLAPASAFITFMIIVAAEIIPKTVGERYKTTISLLVAKPVRVLIWLLKPMMHFINLLTKPFIREHKLSHVSEEEIKVMLEMGRDMGTVEMDEEVLCKRVFRLNDVRAYQVMRPISQIYALPAEKTLSDLKENIINSRFSRIAVYDKDPSDFVGMVQQRVLLREIARDNYEAKVRDFMTDPIFVRHETKADALLEKFQAFHQHLFIVQDDAGKDIGIVTMEDVLEELFGEIYDERDIKPTDGT